MAARLRSVREGASQLGISKDLFRRLIGQGLVDVVRLGKRVLVPQAELDRLAKKGCQK